ncbi:MAG TPA: hypothetical protein VEI06_12385, partial [Gemmatimonadaceae bacterium]|nr:hypothetical protein [Gemmatimonadaceae bacterium]
MTVSQLVGRERTRLLAILTARGVGLALALALALLAAGTLLLGGARWIIRPELPALAWVLVATAVLTVVDVTRKAIQRVVSPGIVARAIEREQSLRAGALRTALEVADKGPLGRRAASQVAERLARGGRVLTPTAHRRATMRGVRAAVAAVVAIVALGAAQASAPDGWRAISHPRAAWRGTLAGPLELTDVPRVVMRGEKLKVRVRAPLRRHVDLRVRATGKAWEVQRLPVEKGDANTVLGPVDADLTLVAGDG